MFFDEITVIHQQVYASFYKAEKTELYDKLLVRFPNLPKNGVQDLRADIWKFVHVFFQLQCFLLDKKKKSFKIFPIAKVNRKHTVYDSRALHELTKQLFPKTVAWPEFKNTELDKTWRQFFDLGKFETKNKKFAGHMKTNGIIASFTFNVCKPNEMTNKKKKQIFDRIVAIDPGARIPLVCYEKKR